MHHFFHTRSIKNFFALGTNCAIFLSPNPRGQIQNLYYNGLCWGATHASSLDQPLTKGSSCEESAAASPAPSGMTTPTRHPHHVNNTNNNTNSATNPKTSERRRKLLQMHSSQHTIEVRPSPKLERLLGENFSKSASSSAGSGLRAPNLAQCVDFRRCGGPGSNNSSFDV